MPIGGCPLGALIQEHEKGRALVAGLAEATEGYLQGRLAARGSLSQSLQGLIALYPSHIWKEDFLLFSMGNKLPSPENQQALQAAFESVEAGIGRDIHERFEQLAPRLEKEARGLSA